MSYAKYLSQKQPGRYMWRGKPIRSFQISANMKLAVVNHKGHLGIAVTDALGNYRSCDKISYTEAIHLMGWFAQYINMVKPLDSTAIYATGKSHLKGVEREQNKMLGLVEAMREGDHEPRKDL